MANSGSRKSSGSSRGSSGSRTTKGKRRVNVHRLDRSCKKADQERNPKTGRCRSLCPTRSVRSKKTGLCLTACKVGSSRSKAGRCKKDKVEKVCKAGKVVNPKSGRCVKKSGKIGKKVSGSRKRLFQKGKRVFTSSGHRRS